MMATISKITTSKGEVRYRVRVVTGHRANGAPIQELHTCRTKKQADAWGAQREADIARGVAVADAKTTVGQYLEEWLTRCERRVRPITVAGYRYQVGRWIAGTALARTPLGRLSPAAVQKWIDAIPYAASARMARAVLCIALNEATRLELLTLNPVSRTTAPAHKPRTGSAWSADEARRLELGDLWTEQGMVCTSALGAPLDERAVQRRFVRLCARAGVPRIRLYDTRHTATSLMLDAGADLKAASEALGHADPRITMRVYRHVRADQRAAALALLAASLAPEDEGSAVVHG